MLSWTSPVLELPFLWYVSLPRSPSLHPSTPISYPPRTRRLIPLHAPLLPHSLLTQALTPKPSMNTRPFSPADPLLDPTSASASRRRAPCPQIDAMRVLRRPYPQIDAVAVFAAVRPCLRAPEGFLDFRYVFLRCSPPPHPSLRAYTLLQAPVQHSHPVHDLFVPSLVLC